MRKEKDFEAYIDDFHIITVYLKNSHYEGNSDFFYLMENGEFYGRCKLLSKQENEDYTEYRLECGKELVLGELYEIIDSHSCRFPAEYGLLVKTAEFENRYGYLDDDLGVIYKRNRSKFALWSPTSKSVTLRLYQGNQYRDFAMIKAENGVFRISIVGDWEGCLYLYFLNYQGKYLAAVDPYALSTTANGECGIIINPAKTVMNTGRVILPERLVDHVIYEVSVRDITSFAGAGVAHPRKYLGLAESGTEYKGYPTGVDYLASLGVTMIQLMPVTDFATVDELHEKEGYNWGYDPAHYHVLEGSYSTNPHDGYKRITEFKAMIRAIHDQGLAVSLDLVYNHVFFWEKDNLNKIVPNYFFRMNNDGELSNGSLCGNDFESRSVMGRKYLLDCCLYWIEEFNIDAFRFDLMGIIDIETMKLITEKAQEIKPEFMVYGEGWDMPTLLSTEEKAMVANHKELSDIAFFSDRFRDVVKAYGSGDISKIEEVKNCLTAGIVGYGSTPFVDNPNQTINYVECHDDQTLWDKLQGYCKDETVEERIERQKLISACVLLAQGVPFLHSGQEFCRTKQMESNSYRSGDRINQIDYQRMIDNFEVVQYIKDMIKLRMDHWQLRLMTKEEIEKAVSFQNLDHGVLLYRLETEREYLDCFINPAKETVEYDYGREVKIIADKAGTLAYGIQQKVVYANPLAVTVVSYEK